MSTVMLSPHRNSKGKKMTTVCGVHFLESVVGSSSLFFSALTCYMIQTHLLLAKCSEMKGTIEMKITYYYGIIFRGKFSIIFRDMLPPSI